MYICSVLKSLLPLPLQLTASVYEDGEPSLSPHSPHSGHSSASDEQLLNGEEHIDTDSPPAIATANGKIPSQTSPHTKTSSQQPPSSTAPDLAEGSTNTTEVYIPPLIAGTNSSPPKLEPAHPPLITAVRVSNSERSALPPTLEAVPRVRMNSEESSLTTGFNPDHKHDPSLTAPALEADHQPSCLQVVRFGNMLDGCASGESAAEEDIIVRSKPAHVGVGGGSSQTASSSKGVSGTSHVPPPASTETVPGLAEWARDHRGDHPPSSKVSFPPSTSSSSSSSPLIKTHSSSSPSEDRSSLLANLSPEARDVPLQLKPFLFPVSNSPVDIVTMLTRLASFTGTILQVLTL